MPITSYALEKGLDYLRTAAEVNAPSKDLRIKVQTEQAVTLGQKEAASNPLTITSADVAGEYKSILWLSANTEVDITTAGTNSAARYVFEVADSTTGGTYSPAFVITASGVSVIKDGILTIKGGANNVTYLALASTKATGAW